MTDRSKNTSRRADVRLDDSGQCSWTSNITVVRTVPGNGSLDIVGTTLGWTLGIRTHLSDEGKLDVTHICDMELRPTWQMKLEFFINPPRIRGRPEPMCQGGLQVGRSFML